jgi:hypothetical protein
LVRHSRKILSDGPSRECLVARDRDGQRGEEVVEIFDKMDEIDGGD